MKALLNFFVFLCLLVTPIAVDLIQSAGPHGGVMKKADNYFIEVKAEDKMLFTYLLDPKLKAISNKDLTCTVRFFMADSTDMILRLKPFEEKGFTGENIPGYRYCKITYKVNDKVSPSAMFESKKPVVNK